MFLKYIPPILLLFIFLSPCPSKGGDLANLTDTLENLADMSRSADDASEAMRNAIKGNPSRYHYYYDDDDYDDDDWDRHRHYSKSKHYRKARAKAIREREWLRHHYHDNGWRKARHHRHHPW